MATQYNICNEHLSATISSTGAELQSLKRRSPDQNDDEIMWHGDAAVWSGRAPVLFPIVGMLKDNCMRYEGVSYPLQRHGFCRTSSFNRIDHSDSNNGNKNSIVLSLASSAETLRVFPWHFELRIAFELVGHKLDIRYQVHNRDSTAMLFTLGSHPAFALAGALDQYKIQFNKRETLDCYFLQDGLMPLHGEPCLDNEDSIALNDTIFDRDALIFKGIKSTEISIVDASNSTRLTVETGGAPHLGIWAKPAAPYVCIEPWFGYSDATDASGEFTDKPQMQTLAAGAEFNARLGLRLPAKNTTV